MLQPKPNMITPFEEIIDFTLFRWYAAVGMLNPEEIVENARSLSQDLSGEDSL